MPENIAVTKDTVQRQALYFRSPGVIDITEESLPNPADAKFLIKTKYSAISAGTELKIYRGQVASEIEIDKSLPSLKGVFGFPMKYGYSLVGEVIDKGSEAENFEIGQRVFAYHPHETLFAAGSEELVPIPPDISPHDALFLAFMETAVGFVMDTGPLAGERGLIFGQGVMGLLSAAILSRFPLAALMTVDRLESRRQTSLGLGATLSLPPGSSEIDKYNPDFTLELSGDVGGLMRAIDISGYDARIIVGSWYGDDKVSHSLGLKFHRNHIRIQSSQVSVIAPGHRGRWNRARRLETAWDMIRRIKPSSLISHRLPFPMAGRAYELLDRRPGDALQVILEY